MSWSRTHLVWWLRSFHLQLPHLVFCSAQWQTAQLQKFFIVMLSWKFESMPLQGISSWETCSTFKSWQTFRFVFGHIHSVSSCDWGVNALAVIQSASSWHTLFHHISDENFSDLLSGLLHWERWCRLHMECKLLQRISKYGLNALRWCTYLGCWMGHINLSQNCIAIICQHNPYTMRKFFVPVMLDHLPSSLCTWSLCRLRVHAAARLHS